MHDLDHFRARSGSIGRGTTAAAVPLATFDGEAKWPLCLRAMFIPALAAAMWAPLLWIADALI